MENIRKQFSIAHVSISLLIVGALCLGAASAIAQNNTSIFGPNVYVLDPGMTTAALNTQLNALNQEGQFSANRHAVLFKPGTYTLSAEVGFYESLAGLGQTPGVVILNGGGLYSDQTDGNGNITTNFWRSVENYTVNPPADPNSNPVTNTNRWGVSQGAPFRRIHVGGYLELTNQNCGFASGGFISDSVIDQTLAACSQQQWYTRNSSIGRFTGGVWNYVFSGVQGAPSQSFPNPPDTTLSTTPVSREKPFLYLDASGNYNVFVPTLKTNSSGTSWSGTDPGPGHSLPIGSFFIAQPSNTAAQINAALATPGTNLILTPGIYQLNAPINITNANTIVLGLGFATLVPQGGLASMTVADVDGVQIAGLLFDAGTTTSPVLLQVGVAGAARVSHQSNPTSLNDVFFRIGGATAGNAVTSLEVDSNNVILDNIWAWRADHGPSGVGWTQNTAAHGVVVNGDNVTALGLAIEHYQQNQTVWNGNGGETIFYQSELPYDVPSQSAWMNGSANGYSSYAVANSVTSHVGYGMGVYSFFNVGPNIIEDSAITVPNVAGVTINDAVTVWLGGFGQITHIVDNAGSTASSAVGAHPQDLVSYGGVACTTNCPPNSPANLTAVAASGTQINLSWTASTTAGATYTIYRSTSSGFTPGAGNQIASVASGTTYANTGLTAGTTYFYVVEATNAAGNSAPSNQASATTNAAVPNPPTALTATAVSTSQINLSWTASTTPGVSYEVFASTTPVFTPSEGTLLASTAGTTYASTGLAASTTYYYAVEAILSTVSAPARASATTQGGVVVPAPPTNLSAIAVSASQINLSWTASTTTGVYYEVFASTTPGFMPSEGTLLASTSGTTYANTGLTAATTYYYAVEAVLSTVSPPARASATTQGTGGGGGTDVIAIDSGSPTAVGSFVADNDFTGGGVYAPGLTVTVPAGLANPAPAAVYQTARQGAITYTLPGLVAGNSYTVRLHFAELYFSGTGQRLFNVAINGARVLTNFDIVAAAGNKSLTAVVESFANITPVNNQIVITFSNGITNQPMVNGVELLTSGTLPPPVGTAIDAGSTAAVGSFGADADFNGGSIYAPGLPVTVPAGLVNAAPAAVYQTAREGVSTYTIPGFVKNSTGHTVTLHFAELYFSGTGQRLFNVAINGTPVLTNFDIVAAAGNKGLTAVVEPFTNITANSSGQIVITFTNGAVNQPTVNGIAVQ